jgi:hypothetical protein
VPAAQAASVLAAGEQASGTSAGGGSTPPANKAVDAASKKTDRSLGANDKLLLIGDSLSVGTDPYIRKDLGGQVEVNAKSGRSLAQGMAEYDAVKNKPKVVEMGLFTNDDPSHVAQLKAAVQKTIDDARARGGRVVWATIVRPPANGVSYDAANDMLRQMAKANPDVMGLVDWQKIVAAHPDYVGGDGVHSSGAGYAARAKAFEDAARA